MKNTKRKTQQYSMISNDLLRDVHFLRVIRGRPIYSFFGSWDGRPEGFFLEVCGAPNVPQGIMYYRRTLRRRSAPKFFQENYLRINKVKGRRIFIRDTEDLADFPLNRSLHSVPVEHDLLWE